MTDINQLADALRDFLEYQKEEGVKTMEVSAETLKTLRSAGAARQPKKATRPARSAIRPASPQPTPAAVAEMAPPPVETFKTLDEVAAAVNRCTKCPLHASCNKAVPGEGKPNQPDILFVGEGPNADEDALGRPFAGEAGQLLTKMIGAMGYTRDQVYITNIVKCRAPGNRVPLPEEITVCSAYLRVQIELIKPKVIVALGKVAVEGLLNKQVAITRFRGTWSTCYGTGLMPTFHPRYLLKAPSKKREAWADLQAVMAKLGEK